MTQSASLPDLEPLLERIRQDARKEAEAIGAEAEAQAERILDEVRSEAEAEAERIKAEAREQGRRREAAELAEARRQGRFQLLAARHELLKEVFREARVRLLGDSEASCRKLLEALLVRYAEPGPLTLVVDPADRPNLDEAFILELNERLDRSNDGSSIEAVEEREGLGGGIVLRRGAREIDASLTTLLEQLRETLEAELAGELFPPEQELPARGRERRAAPG